MHRWTARSCGALRPPKSVSAGVARASCPFRTAFICGTNYIIRHPWYMLHFHEQPGGPPASMGRNRARKSDGNALAENRDGRARDDRADLPEARMRRADAQARER